MQLKRALILDIDFTLIHLERLPDSIEVPGRTRSAWLAPRTVEMLGELQMRFEIILATARSWDGARWIADGLEARGVTIEKAVIEDGARLGRIGDLRAFEPSFSAVAARQFYRWRAPWPRFDWQMDFENCAVARCETPALATQLMAHFAGQTANGATRFYRDGRKVYLLPRAADKWSALQKLLGARAELAVGVGDGLNDLCWLRQIQTPATLAGAAPPIEELARERGLISSLSGHEGIADVLKQIGELRAR